MNNNNNNNNKNKVNDLSNNLFLFDKNKYKKTPLLLCNGDKSNLHNKKEYKSISNSKFMTKYNRNYPYNLTNTLDNNSFRKRKPTDFKNIKHLIEEINSEYLRIEKKENSPFFLKSPINNFKPQIH